MTGEYFVEMVEGFVDDVDNRFVERVVWRVVGLEFVVEFVKCVVRRVVGVVRRVVVVVVGRVVVLVVGGRVVGVVDGFVEVVEWVDGRVVDVLGAGVVVAVSSGNRPS